MPEGPEAYHCSQVLDEYISGMMLTGIQFAEEHPLQIKNFSLLKLPARIERVYAVGKRFIILLSGGVRLVISLRMTGKFLLKEASHTRATFFLGVAPPTAPTTGTSPPAPRMYEKDEKEEKEGKEEMMIDDELEKKSGVIAGATASSVMAGATTLPPIYYDDARPFSKAEVFSSTKTFDRWRRKNLGWDPLGPDEPITMKAWKEIFSSRAARVAVVLLEQKKICGIGNYLRAEILYRAGVAPTRSCDSLNDKELLRLLVATKKIMHKSFRQGGHTLNSFCDPLGRKGMFKPRVYLPRFNPRKENLTKDIYNYPVERARVGTQNIYWCPLMQK